MIITLTTDFGTSDGYVGAMKGTLVSGLPGVQIIDITHEIRPQNLYHAAAALSRALPQFPPDTIHLAVIDPDVGTARKILCARIANQWLLVPDNGILGQITAVAEHVMFVQTESELWRKHATFDGLHVFSPAAIYLANKGDLAPYSSPATELASLPKLTPYVSVDKIKGHLINSDHFGNAQTNIPGNWLKDVAHVALAYPAINLPVVHTFSDVPLFSPCALVNSDSNVEFSINQRSFVRRYFPSEIFPLSIELTLVRR